MLSNHIISYGGLCVEIWLWIWKTQRGAVIWDHAFIYGSNRTRKLVDQFPLFQFVPLHVITVASLLRRRKAKFKRKPETTPGHRLASWQVSGLSSLWVALSLQLPCSRIEESVKMGFGSAACAVPNTCTFHSKDEQKDSDCKVSPNTFPESSLAFIGTICQYFCTW